MRRPNVKGGIVNQSIHRDRDVSRSIDVGEILDQARIAGLPLLVTLIGLLVLILDGFDIQAVAFAAPVLVTKWGIQRSDLGATLAAGLIGMGIGAALFGWFADRRGRKTALLAGTVLFAGGSLLCASASSLNELILYRLITGLGLGAPLPIATALMAEFAPARWRSMCVAVAVVGIPIGGMVGAAIAQKIVPLFGWQAIFIAGGILPMALLAVVAWLLPESPRYLCSRPDQAPRLAVVLNRLVGAQRFRGDEKFYLRESGAVRKTGLLSIMNSEYRASTLVVWLIFFTNILVVYVYFNWLPTVLSAAGLDVSASIRGALVFNLGGVLGSLSVAALLSRFGSRPILVVFALGAIAATFAIGLAFGSGALASSSYLMTMVALAGAFINGVQIGMYSVAAHVYATSVRATGVGWASGIARIGAIASTFAGAAFFALGLSHRDLFTAVALVLVITLTGIVMFRRHIPAPQRTRPGDPGHAPEGLAPASSADR
jgi:AAHS family 4-hydroxybenzoate transporter-like MFS transporter